MKIYADMAISDVIVKFLTRQIFVLDAHGGLLCLLDKFFKRKDTLPYPKGQFSSSIPPQQIAAVSKVTCVRIKNRKYKKRNYFCSVENEIFAKICTCENNPYYSTVSALIMCHSNYASKMK